MKNCVLLLLAIAVFQNGTAQINFVGSGIRFSAKPEGKYYTVVSVIANSPAAAAGINPGDIVYTVDGKSTEGKPMSELTAMIRGQQGMVRVLTVGPAKRTVSITLQTIKGECLSGDCQNGEGKLAEPDSSLYTGHFSNGKFDGSGTMQFANGDSYTGDFAAGKINGRGSYQFKSGNRYEGELVNAVFEGTGTMQYTNGRKYTGTWKKGIKEGKGKMEYEDGGYEVGNFAANELNGYGEFYFKDGKVFKGNWVNGVRTGKGSITATTGDSYEGDWMEGRIEGTGTMHYSTGQIFTGGFKNGQRNGRGKLTGRDGRITEGNWVQDKLQGQATVTYPNGDVLRAVFKDNIASGAGSFRYSNGAYFEGNINDQLLTGTLKLKEGKTLALKSQNFKEMDAMVLGKAAPQPAAATPQQYQLYLCDKAPESGNYCTTEQPEYYLQTTGNKKQCKVFGILAGSNFNGISTVTYKLYYKQKGQPDHLDVTHDVTVEASWNFCYYSWDFYSAGEYLVEVYSGKKLLVKATLQIKE